MQLFSMVVCLLVACSGAFAASNRLQFDIWDSFKVQHGKQYENQQVESLRMEIFMQNKAKVDHFNRNDAKRMGFELGLNHLSDLTEVERLRLNGYKPRLGDEPINSVKAEEFLNRLLGNKSIPVPDKLDWRQVPNRVSRVKDQGTKCGSCWAFSATGALEGQELVLNPNLGQITELSEQQFVDCVTNDEGCGGGLPQDALVDAMQGVEDEKSYPYTGKDGTCKFIKNKATFHTSGFAMIPEGNEIILKEVVAKYGPVSVAIADSSGDLFQYYNGGIYNNPNCTHDLDHAVLIVGYGTDPKYGDYWIVKNSWSEQWGEQGYVKMARNRNNQCGIALNAVIPIFW